MVPLERALVSFYRPNFSSIFTRFRDIVAFVPSACHFFPTPPLVSPKFPHVTLGIGGPPFRLATKSEGAELIVCATSFQDFQPT